MKPRPTPMIPPRCRRHGPQASGCRSGRHAFRATRALAGFTLVEILVVILIIAVLAAVLIPVAGRMVESSRSVACMTNMKNVALGMISYAGDNNGMLPVLGKGGKLSQPNWMDEILPHVTGSTAGRIPGSAKPFGDSFYCPSSKNPHPYGSYGAHPYLIRSDTSPSPSRRLVSIPDLAGTVLLSECFSPTHPEYDSSWYFPPGQANKSYLPKPHRGSLNLAYCDGHIASMKHQEAADNYATLLGPVPLP